MPNYNVINAKVHSILGRRLLHEDYKNLSRLSGTYDIAGYLSKNTDYSKYIEINNTPDIHRDDLERMLKKVLVYYIDKFDNYFNGEYRDFFMTFYLKYEIYDLKKNSKAYSHRRRAFYIKELFGVC
ncbi:V0D/AC39 family V-type ATPase subunit [Thermobrachium celere]|uniref:V0D/AC39 family V-type ATPase subunit n=1 Tax=Thermobrachium celere TaxID=53422 RepID=UPI001940F45A|nr:V-type ATPase subunit [Thermobrachium celere]GFR34417.1 hypothetical protein TCEA9_02290 [Thermobrachium celere]